MRYTTVIDISENRQLYANHNAVLVYLHLCLRAGYHDHDRDMVSISIRNLASDIGVTVSACRHAIKLLTAAGLVTRTAGTGTVGTWTVKKWLIDEPPTPRQKKTDPKSSEGRSRQDIGRQLDEQIAEYKQKVIDAVRQMTRDELQNWLNELKAGRSIRHYGVQLAANQTNIQWLSNQINKQ